MKMLGYLLFPAKWILEKIWRLLRKYWLPGLLLIYLFRGPLLSKPISEFIQEKIKRYSGLELEIGSFGGNYFTNLRLRGIKMQEKKGLEALVPQVEQQTLRDLQIEEISIHYNFLAPFFGGRFLRKIVIQRPQVAIVAGLDPSAAAPSQPKKLRQPRSAKKVSFPLPLLFGNSPTIDIRQANISYQRGQRQVTMPELTFRSAPGGGKIHLRRFVVAQPGRKKQSPLDVDIEWRIVDKIFQVTRLSVAIADSPYRFALSRPIQLNMAESQLALRDFTIPLPGGSTLKGNIDRYAGCHLQLDHLQLDFSDIIDTAAFWQNRKINACSGAITTRLHLDLPHWDLTRIQGRMEVRIGRAGAKPDAKLPTEQKSGFVIDLAINDLQLLERLARSLDPQLDAIELSGKLSLISHLYVQDKQFICEGRLTSSGVTSKYLTEMPMHGSWRLESDLQGKHLKLPKLSLQLAHMVIENRGEIDFTQQRESWCRGHCSLPGLRLFLPPRWRDIVNGEISAQWDIHGMAPGKCPKPKPAALAGKFSLSGDHLSIYDQPLGTVKTTGDVRLNGDVFSLKFQGNGNDRDRFYIQSTGRIGLWSKLDCQGNIDFTAVERYWRLLPPEIGSLLTGAVKVQFGGKHNPAAGGWQFELTLTGRNGSLLGVAYQQMAQVITGVLTPQDLVLTRLQLKRDGRTLLALRGKVGYRPGRASDLQCRLTLDDLARDLTGLLPANTPKLAGRFRGDWRWRGVLPGLAATMVPVTLDSNIQLDDFTLGPLHGRKLRNDFVVRLTADQIALDRFNLSWEDKARLVAQAVIGYTGKLPTQITARWDLPAIERLLPQQLVKCSGRLRGQIATSAAVPWPTVHRLWQKSPAKLIGRLPEILQRSRWQSKVLTQLGDGQINRKAYRQIRLSSMIVSDADSCQLDRCRITLDDQPVVNARGYLDYASGAAALDCRVKLPYLEHWLDDFTGQRYVSGALNGALKLKGRFPTINAPAQMNGKLQLRLQDGRLFDQPYQTIGMQAQIYYDKTGWRLAPLMLSRDQRQLITAHGYLGARRAGKLECRFDVVDPGGYFPGTIPASLLSQGRLAGKIVIEGRLNSPLQLKATGDLAWRNLTLWQRPGREIVVHAQCNADGQRALVKARLNLDGSPMLMVSGTIGQQMGIMTAIIARWRLANPVDYLPALWRQSIFCSGPWTGEWRLTGSLPLAGQPTNLRSEMSWRLPSGKLLDIPYQRLQLLTSAVINDHQVELKQWRLTLDEILLLGAEGRIGYLLPQPIDLRLNSDLGDIANYLVPALAADQGPPLTGACLANMHLSGVFAGAGTEMDLHAKIKLPLTPLSDAEEWKIKAGMLVISGQTRSGEQKHGIELNARFSGPITTPGITATTEIFLPEIRVPTQDFAVRYFRCTAKLDRQRLAITGQTHLGGVPLHWQGEIGHSGYRPQSVNLRLQGQRVLLLRNEEMYGRANIDVSLRGKLLTEQNPPRLQGKLAGKIDIVRFVISKSMTLDKPSERVFVYPGFESPYLDVDLDLAIALSRIIIRNNLMDIESRGELWISKHLAQPEIKGWISTDSGKLYLPQGVMNIRECTIRLRPEEPLVPYLYIKAETNVRRYRIIVILRGRAGDYTLEFQSSPPLSKEDILLLLLTGATRNELSADTDEKLKEAGAFILLQQLLNSIGVGAYISAQVTDDSAAMTITPEGMHGFALQGKVAREGKVRFNVIYRFEIK